MSHKSRGSVGGLAKLSLPAPAGLSLLFSRQARVELVCLKLLRRRLRVSLRRSKGLSRGRRLWLTVSASFPLSLASKGSRMGKGRGVFERWVFRSQALRPWARLLGFGLRRSYSLGARLRALLGPRLRVSCSLPRSPSWGG